ncbi:MAG: hypothetical protein QNL43_01135 [Crocinitomicaceae bacterium]|jgi:hypothetical protein|tara:strand:+ start:12997 stop:13794 length:798 start_codon:yes stop_codon:yes gene_type:complete
MNWFYYFSLLILLAGCSTDDQHNDSPEIEEDLFFRSDFSDGALFFDLKDSIQRNENLNEISSLEYTSNFGEFLKAKAKIDTDGVVHMLVLDREFENQLKKDSFYYRNGLKRISIESSSQFNESESYFSQTISFYSDSGTILYSGIRTATDLDTLEELSYTKIQDTELKDGLTLRLLKSTAPFQTAFLGTAYSKEQEKLFLIVGNPDRSYTSTLAIEEKTVFINELIKNEDRYMGVPLDIDFAQTKLTDGFTYQTLLSAKVLPTQE